MEQSKQLINICWTTSAKYLVGNISLPAERSSGYLAILSSSNVLPLLLLIYTIWSVE